MFSLNFKLLVEVEEQLAKSAALLALVAIIIKVIAIYLTIVFPTFIFLVAIFRVIIIVADAITFPSHLQNYHSYFKGTLLQAINQYTFY